MSNFLLVFNEIGNMVVMPCLVIGFLIFFELLYEVEKKLNAFANDLFSYITTCLVILRVWLFKQYLSNGALVSSEISIIAELSIIANCREGMLIGWGEREGPGHCI